MILEGVPAAIDSMRSLVFTISYFLGFTITIAGIYKAKDYAENPQQTKFITPAMYFIVGILCMWMPEFMKAMLMTLYSSPTIDPFNYSPASEGGENVALTMSIIIMFIQLVGVIGFLRGILLLKGLGQSGGQNQDALAKALTHILGGILAVNIVGTAGLIAATFGMENPLANFDAFAQGLGNQIQNLPKMGGAGG